MTPLFLMIPMSLILGFGFVVAFIYGAHSGQFDDLETPAHRMLEEEKNKARKDLKNG